MLRSSVSLLVLAGLLAAAPVPVGGAGPLKDRLDPVLAPYLQNGCVLVADGRGVVYVHGDPGPMIPASTLKMATALAALHYLGEVWRPKTEFYLSPDHDLIVRGYGDPFLVSEEMAVIAARLARLAGLPRSLRQLRLDASAFSPDIRIPGLDHLTAPAYARNGALAVNFNTVHVTVRADRTVTSAEPGTPLTPVSRGLAAGLAPGTHRVSLSAQPEASLIYAGEMLHAFLEPMGYTFREGIRAGRVHPEDRWIHTHRNTRSLREILAAMMLHSNNFIANQLLLGIGLERHGEPATLDKGLGLLREYLTAQVGIPPGMFRVVEGSGISRENRLHPEALVALARAFLPHRSLLVLQGGVPVKTGTLRGVYTVAGILDADRPLVFAVMLNQEKNHRDRILSVLLGEFTPERVSMTEAAPSGVIPGPARTGLLLQGILSPPLRGEPPPDRRESTPPAT